MKGLGIVTPTASSISSTGGTTFTDLSRTASGRWPIALMLMAACGVAGADTNNFADAVTAGEAHAALRYRFEHVDQESFTDEANASTLRLRLNYATGAWRDFKAFAEFDYVGEVLVNDFNSGEGTSPGRTRYPVVADPEGADLNQVFVDYNGVPGWQWRLGRQRIVLDDHRFVGDVGWRQNVQTFDGMSITVRRLPKTELFYSVVTNANRIFGDTVPGGDHSMNTHLLNARITVNDQLSATPYGYYIDNDDDPAASTFTIGVRLAANYPLGQDTLSFLAEVSKQTDAANAPVDFDAGYLHLEAQWAGQGGLSLGVGIESLGGDRARAGAAFRTPLATLHAFQGWADQFAVTPNAGIDDLYGTLSCRRGPWRWQAALHDFRAESGPAKYGREFDFSVGRNLGERYALLLKSAFFDAGDAAFSDTRKYWLMFTADY